MQITLTGNKISSTGGNQLVADLTGDTNADVTFGEESWGPYYVAVGIDGGMRLRAVNMGGMYVLNAAVADGAGVGLPFAFGPVPQSASYMNHITFTDQRINGGAPTEAWLQVNAFNTSGTSQTVELSRLIFDDASTTRPAFASVPGAQTEWSAVPEPSSFALLALGAGGLLARRRRAMAA